jgi:VHL beta domain
VPELSLSFFGEFYLNGKLQVTVSPSPRPPADPCASAGDHWKSAEAIGTSAAFEDHLARYPTCAFAGLARARLDALKAKQATVAPAPAAPPNAVIPNDANRAAAVPDATCASESSLRSLNGNQSVTMTFQNQSSEPITAFWLDYSGKRVFYRRLNGGESYAQPTYISHPWVFVDANGKCRRIVMPSISQKVVAIR